MKLVTCCIVIVLGCTFISSETTLDRRTRFVDSTSAVRSFASDACQRALADCLLASAASFRATAASSFICADSRNPIIKHGTPAATPIATIAIHIRSQLRRILFSSSLCSFGSLRNKSISSAKQPIATNDSAPISIHPRIGKYDNRSADFIIICGIASAAIAIITAIAVILKSLVEIRKLKRMRNNRGVDYSI